MPAIMKDLFDRLNPWHEKEAPHPPPISSRTAAILLVAYALSYFLPFYLSGTTRPSPTLTRDAPSVIRARVRSVALSCLCCGAVTYVVLARAAGASATEALHLGGLWPLGLAEMLRTLLLTGLLFLGPLFSDLVVHGGWRQWLRLQPLREITEDWVNWRNLVAGPITEELLFRSASVPLMLVARTPIKQTIFLSPVIFGLAHFHHFYEFRLTHPRVPVAAALVRSLFQLTYTTLFGAYATFLYVRTGSLGAVVLLHAFCNYMGLPQVGGLVHPGQHDDDDSPRAGAQGRPRRSVVIYAWTASYYILLVVGAWGWWKSLWSLTKSGNALVPPEAFLNGWT